MDGDGVFLGLPDQVGSRSILTGNGSRNSAILVLGCCEHCAAARCKVHIHNSISMPRQDPQAPPSDSTEASNRQAQGMGYILRSRNWKIMENSGLCCANAADKLDSWRDVAHDLTLLCLWTL